MPEIGPLEQPDVRPVGERLYRLQSDYAYEWEHGGVARRISVYAGFRSDGASVPRVIWTLTGILPDGLIRAAALIHDWLYAHRRRLPPGSYQEFRDRKWVDVVQAASREEADRLFARIMREAGVPRLRRRLAYLAVRACGWWVWRR